MDELIKQGQWWWTFAVPLATGLLALLGSWLGSKWGKSTEHKQWLRNKKMEAYSEFLSVAEAMADDLVRWPEVEATQHSISELRMKRTVLKVVGSPKARHAAMNVEVNVWIILRLQQICDTNDAEGWGERSREEHLDYYRVQIGDLQNDLVEVVSAVRTDLGAYSAKDAEMDAKNRAFVKKFLSDDPPTRVKSPVEIV